MENKKITVVYYREVLSEDFDIENNDEVMEHEKRVAEVEELAFAQGNEYIANIATSDMVDTLYYVYEPYKNEIIGEAEKLHERLVKHGMARQADKLLAAINEVKSI